MPSVCPPAEQSSNSGQRWEDFALGFFLCLTLVLVFHFCRRCIRQGGKFAWAFSTPVASSSSAPAAPAAPSDDVEAQPQGHWEWSEIGMAGSSFAVSAPPSA
ncbi:unnamed protein product [Eruca vesicaria subsp. sativa]|uniref:Uncharacterized protein n=1 Tax=Eruca vesicaria subsp. sativa TaxID=29727 RepID=A0ABC8KUK7_ERUVS|nr:unnamed protein product [Eruca vesicaria subsp. sativa]